MVHNHLYNVWSDKIDGGAGSHGLDMPEDINIVHCFKAVTKRD